MPTVALVRSCQASSASTARKLASVNSATVTRSGPAVPRRLVVAAVAIAAAIPPGVAAATGTRRDGVGRSRRSAAVGPARAGGDGGARRRADW